MIAAEEILRRAEELRASLASCRLCAHRCGVNRLQGERGFCEATAQLEVSSECVHHGEEPVLMGREGVGNFFLAHCNMRCVYCQNHQISQTDRRFPRGEESVAESLLRFGEMGCPTAGFVSPTHYAPQILRAVGLAAEKGFDLPLIYNTNCYDSPELVRMLDGIFRIYLPDFRYWDDEYAVRYSSARGYREAAKAALKEMYQQVGGLEVGPDGVARSGVMVRLLVLPNGTSGTERILRYIAEELSTDVGISLLAQYNPVHRARDYPPLNRRLWRKEYASARKTLEELGFHSGYTQDLLPSPDSYLPDFERGDPFG
ncbi:radical SAM protein [Candidatus Fermentibacteria bacterium]|nr:radical SAM protein [Candidatus Fermentibacteria bacterium]